ncbi:hypothetical protein TrLO_g10199 [Triparma laevis f. longispina]|uniref:Fatty acid hydroxylase domain-containing protein n=1 Tax=Triparma laevis f. longispina TaxID=1714387 RepID=A0A9W7CIL2_9STRA|nr:hypothetical protein TrLO_g10199 [Triparma laevis f. longispina]
MDALRHFYELVLTNTTSSPFPNWIPSYMLPISQTASDLTLPQTIILSFFQNVLAWSTVYLPTMAFIWVFKAQLQRFKINPDETPADLKRKELRRTLVSLLLLALWDVFVLAPQTFSTNKSEVVNPIRVLTWLFMFVWNDAHFYTIHRSLHHPMWYRQIHKIHHESINPNPLSGLSFHPVEGVVYFSALLVTFLIPLSPIEYTIYKFGLVWAPLGGHIGYTFYDVEKNPLYPRRFEHYVHHVKFNNNFGAGLFPDGKIWDWALGTVWPEDKPIERQGGESKKSK